MTDSSGSDQINLKSKLQQTEDYVHQICRSCLREVHKNYFWLESYYLEKKILEVYRNVTSIEIGLSDHLPKKVCTSCYDNIIKFDLFKNKVLESEKILAENVILASLDSLDDSIENKADDDNKNTIKAEVKFASDTEDDQCFNEPTDSEDEVPILERLQKEIEPVENHETENKNTQIEESTKTNGIKDSDNEEPKVLKILPKAKFKKRVTKRTSRTKTGDKERRVRKKESCTACGKELFAYKMENHMRTHTKEKPYSCGQCKARFSEKSNLNRHIKIHGTDRPYKCEICEKGFLRPSSRKIHELTAHKSEKNIFCPICAKGFKHQYFMNKHMANIHNKSDFKVKVEVSGYPCSICGQFYRTKSSLSVHKMKHEQPKAFLCNICGKAYSTKAVMENHQKVHTGEKNFSCSTCDKKFRFLSTLKTHVLVHSGEKPLWCHICGKQFRQHSHLNTHVKGQHSTSRPYQCTFCSKTFKQSCNLRVHTRIHTGETPYLCDICQKGFYDSSSMKKHKKSHFDKNIVPVSWGKMELDLSGLENGALQT